MPKQKRICKNCCFLFVPQDIAGVMIPYTGGPVDYACFLTNDEVELNQPATKTCGFEPAKSGIEAELTKVALIFSGFQRSSA
jgi:hypothetical protein